MHDERTVFQPSRDKLPAIDIHSLGVLPDARHQRSRQVASLGETPHRPQKKLLRGGQTFRVPSVRDQETGHAAHEPLSSSKMPEHVLAEVPLTGLSLSSAVAVALRGVEAERPVAVPSPHAAVRRRMPRGMRSGSGMRGLGSYRLRGRRSSLVVEAIESSGRFITDGAAHGPWERHGDTPAVSSWCAAARTSGFTRYGACLTGSTPASSR